MLEMLEQPRHKTDYFKISFFTLGFIVAASSVIFFLSGEAKLALVCIGFIAVLFVLTDIKKYILTAFIASMFLVVYLIDPLKIQTINLVFYLFFFFYLVNWQTGVFNNFHFPQKIKIASGLLIFTVLLSLIRSPHFSLEAVIMTSLFFTYFLSGYLVYKYIKNEQEVVYYLNLLFCFTAISGVIIIFQIIFTGVIRSVGLAGFAIIDFAAMSLVAIVIMHILLGKPSLLMKICFFIILIILITTLSRFAWLGFMLSLGYGIIISALFTREESSFVRKKFFWLFISGLFLISLVFVTGLHNFFIERFSDLNFSELFTQSDEKELIENSLETRILIWIVAINTFLQNIWTGIGYHMFHVVSESYNMLPDQLFDPIVKGLDAHTTFLNILVDLGIIGFLFFAFFLYQVFRYSWKTIKLSKNLSEKRISITLNTLVFFVIVHSVYSGAFTFGQNAFLMYFIFALNMVYYSILKNKRKLEES